MDPFDPFSADDKSQNSPFETENSSNNTSEVKPVSNNNSVTVQSDSAISVTLKGGKEFDAPWIVVKGATVDEAAKILSEVGEKNLLGLVRRASQAFIGTAGSAQGAVSSREPQRQPKPVQAPQSSSGGVAIKTCEHGERIRKVVNTKYGERVAWNCRLPYRDPNACKTIWGD